MNETESPERKAKRQEEQEMYSVFRRKALDALDEFSAFLTHDIKEPRLAHKVNQAWHLIWNL